MGLSLYFKANFQLKAVAVNSLLNALYYILVMYAPLMPADR
jgi:hypothetical protein